MKQQIIKISNIRFKDFDGLKRLQDIRKTHTYEVMRKRNPNVFDIDVVAAYAKTVLLYEHDVQFETEYVSNHEYAKAAMHISNLEPFDCFADDAGEKYVQHDWKYYIVSWPPVMYMYCDEWFINGYGAFIQGKDLDAALDQVIYEYLLRFMPVYVS